jgi:glucose-1-phosphate thymidylyltransferase
MQCFILAGGFATRLWPLTEKRAKPLLPLQGQPLLSHVVSKVPENMPITVSTNAVFGDDMKAWAKTLPKRSITIRIEDTGHEDQKLGALGAVRAWMEMDGLDDDVLLLAGDNYIGFDLTQLIRAYHGNPILVAHDLQDISLARSFGTVIVEKNDQEVKTVKAFEEKPEKPKSSLISTGCSILPKEHRSLILDYAKRKPDNIGGIFEEFLAKNISVECLVSTDMWRDIGSFESYLETNMTLLKNTQMMDPSSSLDAASSMKGGVFVGPKTRIGHSTIENCVLFGSSIINDCVLRDCVVDEGCTLTGVDIDGKMIRAGTTLIRSTNS